MAAFILFMLLWVGLFSLAFFTKRRFGMLALALAAGALLSANGADSLTPFIEQQGVILKEPPLSVLVQTSLTLLPVFLLLINAPKYGELRWRLLGSLGFALLGFTFLLPPITDSVLLEDVGLDVYGFFHTYQSLIIVLGMTGAVIDIMLTKKTKGKKGV